MTSSEGALILHPDAIGFTMCARNWVLQDRNRTSFEMIDACRLSWVNPCITHRFPVIRIPRVERYDLWVLRLDTAASMHQVACILERFGLRHAGLPQLTALCEFERLVSTDRCIIALGNVTTDAPSKRAVYVEQGTDGTWTLNMGWFEHGFPAGTCFLALEPLAPIIT
ncbi:MAG: hypothetical protein ABIG66_03250 [Candidatus Kerfeldbacteria bacterium]